MNTGSATRPANNHDEVVERKTESQEQNAHCLAGNGKYTNENGKRTQAVQRAGEAQFDRWQGVFTPEQDERHGVEKCHQE